MNVQSQPIENTLLQKQVKTPIISEHLKRIREKELSSSQKWKLK